MPNAKFASLILFAILLVAIGLLRRPGWDNDLDAILAHRAGDEWIAMVGSVLREFSSHSSVVKSWSINSRDASSPISIYILDSRGLQGEELTRFRNNCRYLGDGYRIVCDVSLIRNMVTHFGLDKREETESDVDGHIVKRYLVAESETKVRNHYNTMLTWVLAHELGHLVNGHRGEFYFQNHAFDKAIPVGSYCHKLELEADAFLASLYSSESEQTDLYLFLYDLVNREISRQMCPNQSVVLHCEKIAPGTGLSIAKEPLTYTTDKSHPDYILRLLRMVDIIHDRQDFGILSYQARQLISSGFLKPPGRQYYAADCGSMLR